jgi:hypothetical protein
MATESGEAASLAPAGWYPDAGNPDRERLWTGERWINWVRPLKPGRSEATPVGWYDDSGHPGFQRLWSGEMWTEEIRRTPVVAAPPPQAPGAPAVAASQGSVGAAQASVAVGAAVGGAAGAAGVGGGAGVQPVPPSFHPNQWSLEAEAGPTMTYHDTRAPDRLGGLGNWVRLALGACIATSAWQLIANQHYIGVEKNIIGGEAPSLTDVQSASHAVHVSHTITLIVELITAIVFIAWFYRAYCNLVRVGISDLRFGPGWAVGGWFIPIFNLFRQKQIANDIWKASAGAGTVGLARRGEIALSGTLNWWWAAWIASGVITGIGGAQVSSANSTVSFSIGSLRHEETGLWWNQVGLVVAIAATVLAILFVGAVSRLQDQNFNS